MAIEMSGSAGSYGPLKELRGPSWLHRILNEKHFHDPYSVYLGSQAGKGSYDPTKDPPHDIDDTDMREFAIHLSRFSQLETLEISSQCITDKTLELISQMPNRAGIKRLGFGLAWVSNAGVQHLKAFPKLSELDLSNTKIDDGCVEYLGDLSGLKQLNISYTNISDEGLATLRIMLPDCQIECKVHEPPKEEPNPFAEFDLHADLEDEAHFDDF
jgi:hypothetical protein